ncbi:MAG TPA: hypothetical protein VK989_08220 [Polyangia bacterium]|jgi:hypothetical protein|nr:hypothetical protein [Polyangia bacterium]
MANLGNGRDRGRESGEIAVGMAGEEVAHVRARFAVDPSTPARLADAWTAPTGTTEEDESEFVDAVADCLSVGLPLDAAVASWRAGTLEVSSDDDEDDDDTTVFEDARTGVFAPR